MQSSNANSNASSFFFDDDIDEDHFLVRKHLHRYSFGDYLNQPRPTGSSVLFHRPQLSSVLKKPILFPPSNKKTDEHKQSSINSIDQPKQDQPKTALENSQSSNDPLDSVSHEEVNQTKPASKQDLEFPELTPQSPPPKAAVDSETDSYESELHQDSCHGDDRQVSTPDSLEEMESIRELRKNQLEDGEFKMDKNESDALTAIKSQSCNRMSKIISYDEALNIPQTDDDKERMTTSRRKERPANLLIPTPNVYRSTSRPTSARTSSRKYLGVEDRRDSFLGSLQSLNSSSRAPLTPRSPNACQLSPDAERQDFLRRTQSFRASKSVGGGRRSTMGPELVSHIQESAKSLSSRFEYLTPKDQKVLAVLLAKREQEKEEERLKEEMQFLWEAEKLIRDKSRLSLHQTVAKDSPCGHRTSEECLNESCLVFRSIALEERKQNESRLKLQQALERKKRVELRLEEQKRKNEEHVKELKEKQKQDLERAMNIKNERNEQIKQKMSKQVESTMKKVEQLKSKKMSDQELSNIQENMKATLSAAEKKAKKMKEEEANKIGKKRQMKVEIAQHNHKSMEEELKVWQEQAKNYRQQQDKHAEELQAIQLAQRKAALMKSREAKEQTQKQNLQRILEKEKEWRSSLEASILNKEEKAKLLNHEKESLVQKSRAQAQLTRRLREELKLNQSLTDLDKLSKYVALQRKILS